MKSVDHKFNPPQIMLWSSKYTKMIRKGKSGGASELITIEQQRQIDTYCQSELKRLGSDFPYDKMFMMA